MSPPPGEVGESVPIPRARAGTLFPWLLCAACPTRESMAASGAHPNRRPLLALILLSPVIAEMLSGSTPPIEWLNPIGVLFLIWLYGAGVLVMRETAVRWQTGWPSPWHPLGALAAIIFLGWAAWRYADRLRAMLPAKTLPRSPRIYALAGFAFLMGSFLVYGGGPALGVYPIVTVLEGAGLLVGVMLLIRRTSGDPDRWARQRFAFVAGCVG